MKEKQNNQWSVIVNYFCSFLQSKNINNDNIIQINDTIKSVKSKCRSVASKKSYESLVEILNKYNKKDDDKEDSSKKYY